MPEPDVRRADDRYVTSSPGVTTHHSLSYGEHYDPDNVGFGYLRAINEEVVAPGGGYHTHHHEDVEIVTWVLDGRLAHHDTAGTTGVVPVGVAQRLTAGRGVEHSERNASTTEPLRFVQMMLTPDAWQVEPSYAHTDVASTPGWHDAVGIHQHGARLLVGHVDAGSSLVLPEADLVHVHVTRGAVTLGADRLVAGDCARISGPASYDLRASASAELLVWLMTLDPNR